jgi:hypothetical protein
MEGAELSQAVAVALAQHLHRSVHADFLPSFRVSVISKPSQYVVFIQVVENVRLELAYTHLRKRHLVHHRLYAKTRQHGVRIVECLLHLVEYTNHFICVLSSANPLHVGTNSQLAATVPLPLMEYGCEVLAVAGLLPRHAEQFAGLLLKLSHVVFVVVPSYRSEGFRLIPELEDASHRPAKLSLHALRRKPHLHKCHSHGRSHLARVER